jgi:hypothetical protein
VNGKEDDGISWESYGIIEDEEGKHAKLYEVHECQQGQTESANMTDARSKRGKSAARPRDDDRVMEYDERRVPGSWEVMNISRAMDNQHARSQRTPIRG